MPSKNPKKIYRYQPFNALSLDSLCNDQLYFSDPSSFNDPLDCKPSVERDSNKEALRVILATLIRRRVEQEVLASLKAAKLEGDGEKKHAEEQARQAAENELRSIGYHATNPDYNGSIEEAECSLLTYGIQAELTKRTNRGVCCLSAEYDNPLLWSHYGDQHRGICIGYSLDRNPKPIINEVLYGGIRTVKTSLIGQAIVNDDPDAQKAMDDSIFLRKALPWSYEKEWRVLDRVGLQDSPLLLEEVTFGLRCSSTLIHSVMAALKPRDIEFYCMHEDGRSFELKRSNYDIGEICVHLPRTSRSGIEIFGPAEKIEEL